MNRNHKHGSRGTPSHASQQHKKIQQSTTYQQNTQMNMNGGGIEDDEQSITSTPLGGETVKVCLRVRPLNQQEQSRNDEYITNPTGNNHCQLSIKGQLKDYRYNYVLDEGTRQSEVFNRIQIDDLISSVLEGYSATVFAYGQTGSGKTYTMAGQEEKLSREEGIISDESEGIIPRAFRNLWSQMTQKQENFFVKASYAEIYNEQLRDLLNPSSGVLHVRWNAKNGFFIEDLMIVECISVDDLIAVLHEGMKHRKIGSHELNKDSSRSHSILTVYVISEVAQEGQTNNQNSNTQNTQSSVRRYGKISFVDLAGSERLKESKSQGEMIKETGNINKSLFVLGKVINGLTDKSKKPFIPYRDSKLTQLLMDSLGGTSKALMIACVSPSGLYLDETLRTLNYASRTMNIKNKPVIQMDQKDQIINNLQREVHILQLENQYLRQQLQRVSKGLPLEMPDFYRQTNMNVSNKQLPPLLKGNRQPSDSRPISNQTNQMSELNSQKSVEVPVNKIINEYQFELDRIKQENQQLRNAREIAETNYHIVMNDNNALQIKLENLENVFIGKNNGQQNDYQTNNLQMQNQQLVKRIQELEESNIQLNHMARRNNDNQGSTNEVIGLKQKNTQLQKRIEYYQLREKELLEQLNRSK